MNPSNSLTRERRWTPLNHKKNPRQASQRDLYIGLGGYLVGLQPSPSQCSALSTKHTFSDGSRGCSCSPAH